MVQAPTPSLIKEYYISELLCYPSPPPLETKYRMAYKPKPQHGVIVVLRLMECPITEDCDNHEKTLCQANERPLGQNWLEWGSVLVDYALS